MYIQSEASGWTYRVKNWSCLLRYFFHFNDLWLCECSLSFSPVTASSCHSKDLICPWPVGTKSNFQFSFHSLSSYVCGGRKVNTAFWLRLEASLSVYMRLRISIELSFASTYVCFRVCTCTLLYQLSTSQHVCSFSFPLQVNRVWSGLKLVPGFSLVGWSAPHSIWCQRVPQLVLRLVRGHLITQWSTCPVPHGHLKYVTLVGFINVLLNKTRT